MVEKPSFKPKIRKRIEVIFGNNVWYAKDDEDAKRLVKKIAKQLEEEWDADNSENKKTEGRREFIDYYVGNYTEFLKKELWHDVRDKDVSGEIIKLKKDVVRILSGIQNQKIRVKWHQGMVDDSTSYSIENVPEGEEVRDR